MLPCLHWQPSSKCSCVAGRCSGQQQAHVKWRTFPSICISSSAQLHKGALGPFIAFTTCLLSHSMSASWSSFYPFMLTGTSVPVPCPTSLWIPWDNKLDLSSCDKLISSSGTERRLLIPLHELHAGVGCCRISPSSLSLCRAKRLKQLLQFCAWLSLGWGTPIRILAQGTGILCCLTFSGRHMS